MWCGRIAFQKSAHGGICALGSNAAAQGRKAAVLFRRGTQVRRWASSTGQAGPPSQQGPQGADYLALDDANILRQCKVETFRASGPGGQHRNKTDSGVRITHVPTGTAAVATERRSQHENRENAIRRLRSNIALKVRRELDNIDDFEVPEALAAILPSAAKNKRLGPKHRNYPRGVQIFLDLMVANGLSVADTARILKLSTGALSRFITNDPQLLAEVNQLRQAKGLKPLRRN
mmetsp:Transcript_5455/g.14227  ORF Transcript_5455/g.14227 Transcript_5455/m.14227 type:complete len:233 (+) Transcript_5455:10-708(+)